MSAIRKHLVDFAAIIGLVVIALVVASVILANLVIGENVVPEFLQEQCTPPALADALARVLADTPERQRQLDAFARLDGIMATGGRAPSDLAAMEVLALMPGR